ncbi:hypothetical protein EYC84_002040 [Monilinia fructicola]|uniref:Carboxylesterase type B domain-containing protein n=1 Tax=Monilinia fructicola TaxID=38448 RepID=A0A5M9JU20_MONFR|nr:hypothetical protein EYC84_002040 [Monilinia fructicola]
MNFTTYYKLFADNSITFLLTFSYKFFRGITHNESSHDVYEDDAISMWQFRGIKYGKIPARFMQAELNEEFENFTDYYHYGPRCPQKTRLVRLEDALIGIPDRFVNSTKEVFDELNCLDVIITTPDGQDKKSKLPVMPIVHVALNYRLGPLGYVGSEELRKELGNINRGNYGLRDINLAITWISKHIAPFGGSPGRLTIYSESAGSVCVESQIHSLLPPHFHRAIMQSQTMGQPLFSTPQSIEAKSDIYNKLKENIGVKTVKELQQVEWKKLIEAYGAIKTGSIELGMIDDEFFGKDWRTRFSFKDQEGESIANKTPPEVMMGNTGREGTTEEILRTYHITIPAAPVPASDRQLTDPNLADSLLTILENLFFYKGTAEFIAHAQAHSKHKVIVRQFIFQQRNPLLTAGNFTISQPMFWISFIFIGRRESLMIL